MRRCRLLFALPLALGCVPAHPGGRFFDPATPGTLTLPSGSTLCGRAYGLRIYALPTDGGRIAGETDFLLTDCPNMARAEEEVRESAQEVPITLMEVESFRLGIVAPNTQLFDGDGRHVNWVTDGYTILCEWSALREATHGAFQRASLLVPPESPK